MEAVLDVYERPADPRRPLVCVDELHTQLIGETRVPIAAKPGQVERFDYEYVRNGTANVFIAFEPLSAHRLTKVTERRTRVDFAEWVRDLANVHYPTAEAIRADPGQPEHAFDRVTLRGVRAGGGAAPCSKTRDPLHAQARVVAQYG